MFGHSAGNSKSLGAPKFVSRFVLFQRDMIIDHNANEDALVKQLQTPFSSHMFSFQGWPLWLGLGSVAGIIMIILVIFYWMRTTMIFVEMLVMRIIWFAQSWYHGDPSTDVMIIETCLTDFGFAEINGLFLGRHSDGGLRDARLHRRAPRQAHKQKRWKKKLNLNTPLPGDTIFPWWVFPSDFNNQSDHLLALLSINFLNLLTISKCWKRLSFIRFHRKRFNWNSHPR